MGVEVTQDLWKSHNPIRWDQKRKSAFVSKHGLMPHWANEKWRDRRGWSPGMRPIKQNDPRFKDALACLDNPPDEDAIVIKDGKYYVGDSVLAVQDIKQWQLSQARRDYLANRKLTRAAEGSSMQAELNHLQSQGATESDRTAGRYIELYKPTLKHERDGQSAIKSGTSGKGGK